MARRLRAHYRAEGRSPAELWWLQRATKPAFTFEGRECSVKAIPSSEGDKGVAGVRVTWGEAHEDLAIGGRIVKELPDLKRYEDWIAVLRMASGASAKEVQAKEATGGTERPRLLVVARQPAEGYDAKTWGVARYKDWRYVFLELGVDGGITRSESVYRDLDDDPRSWRFAAAMQVTPGLFTPGMRSASPFSYPNYKPVQSAMASMGWTWPASGVAVLTLVVGGLLLASSYVRRDWVSEDSDVESRDGADALPST